MPLNDLKLSLERGNIIIKVISVIYIFVKNNNFSIDIIYLFVFGNKILVFELIYLVTRVLMKFFSKL